MKQGTPEWHAQRAGKLTGSQFAAALGISPYCSRQKLWRLLTGREQRQETNAAMQYGVDNEPNAISWYEAETGLLVRPVGFIQHPVHDFIGVSPDGLVSERGSIEAKCPVSGRLYECVPEYYLPQVIGVIHVSERDWCDFICWTPHDASVTRIERNDAQWAKWEAELVAFWNDFVLADIEPPKRRKNGVRQ